MPSDPQDVADLLEILEDFPKWKLPTEKWGEVGRLLDRLSGALPEVPRELVARLELASPFRVPRIARKSTDPAESGDDPLLFPPPQILERANQLIHAHSTDKK